MLVDAAHNNSVFARATTKATMQPVFRTPRSPIDSAILSWICLLALAQLATAKPPNVLFVICDDLNTNVSTSGYEAIQTPAFEQLAAEGMVFNRAYCQYPVCGPSRASLLHGLYPESTGVTDNSARIAETLPGTVSMPQRFKEAGYWTGAVGKVFHRPDHDPGDLAWHQVHRFSNDEMPLVTPHREKFEAQHGSIQAGPSRKLWREHYPTIAKQTRGQHVGYGPSGLRDDQHADGKNARQVCSWITEQTYGDKPFFITCGIQKPHVPFLAPNAYFDAIPRNSLPIMPASFNYWKQAPPIAKTRRYEQFGFTFPQEDDTLRREYVQAYNACIAFIDSQIGLIFESLRQSGEWDNTIVVLTSDHGYLLGEHFMWGKAMLFEQCNRIPMVIRAPSITRPGSKTDSLMELVDLFPTLGDLCEVPVPSGCQGQSVVPILRDPSSTGKGYAYTVLRRGDRLAKAVRTHRWHYNRWPNGQEELYDLNSDRELPRNQAIDTQPPGALLEMRSLLTRIQEHSASVSSPAPLEVSR